MRCPDNWLWYTRKSDHSMLLRRVYGLTREFLSEADANIKFYATLGASIDEETTQIPSPRSLVLGLSRCCFGWQGLVADCKV